MTPLHHAFVLKGWSLDKNPPSEVKAAVEAIIEVLGQEAVTVVSTVVQLPPLPDSVESSETPCQPEADEPEAVAADPADDEPEPTPVASEPARDVQPRKKRNFSPEARAAASERMRAMQAKKRAEKEGKSSEEHSVPAPPLPAPVKPYAPVPYEKLASDHSGYAGKRDPGQPLTDDDWPDIKARLTKSPDRRAIAGDYDVELDDLNFFISSCQRREGKSPGEALAPSSSGASGAVRRTW
ncbi:hypothetical protein J8F10_09065 [Gemmata sp. G18]|uniref:Uncharacterized protein n=1 Tax=Gemmata palustris TaxID=2822762 RepID=A0ABS5BQ43_9BACT|nr:hypothetical protein [Gemmata palustris]MBP3955430.1 hypothetical protein [Gemmata palustris]